MATCRLSLLLLLPLLAFAIIGKAQQQQQEGSEARLQDARECRIQRFSATRPSRRIESEGGVTELWNELQDQFMCAGVGAMRNILEPNSLSLPNYSPSPRLVYIERGEGLMGFSFPGCPETIHSRGRSAKGQEMMRDQHQKVHRIRRGDLVAVPAGASHWCYNDGNEELVAFSVTDLNSQSNQLDQRFRSFYLAGAQSREASPREQAEREPFGQSILHGFDSNLIAESLNIPVDLARRLQRDDQRGLIVRVKREGMSMLQPAEEEEEEERMRGNVFEEDFCTMRVKHNMDNTREADFYSRQQGRLNVVDRSKFPILQYLDMSAVRATLFPNAVFVPEWSMTGHSIMYVIRGEGHFQVTDNSGRAVLDGMVKEGDVVIVPQNYVSMKKAGSNGIEWIEFMTSSMPVGSALVGPNSVFMGMPLQVLANSYMLSDKEARGVKYNRASKP